MRIAEHAIEYGDHFTHDGGEAKFWWFASGAEALVESGEYGVVLRGGDGGHVEHSAHFAAPAADVARFVAFAALIGIGHDSD